MEILDSLYYKAYKIMSGELIISIRGKTYKLVNPSLHIKHEAERVYQDCINKNRFENFLTDAGCLKLLVKNGFCSPQVDSNLKELDVRIEDLKIDLYSAMSIFRSDQEKKARQMLERVRLKKNEIIFNRHMFDYLTVQGFAEMAKRQYLICCSLYNMDDTLVWFDPSEADMEIVEKVIFDMNSSMVSQVEIREIARNDPWRSYWNINKASPFNLPAMSLTEEQRVLILFSKMYDSTFEHPKCPPENIVNDDDALDGWMAKERRESEREKTNDAIEQKTKGGMQNADEVFIPVASRKDAKKINNMNTMGGKITKIQRANVIKKKGVVADSELPDRKLKIQMDAVNEQVQNVKGRKK